MRRAMAGKYREWSDSYVIRTVHVVESPRMWIDGREVRRAANTIIPGRLEIKPLYLHGLHVVRNCSPTAIPWFTITDDFGNLVRMDYYQFVTSTEMGYDDIH